METGDHMEPSDGVLISVNRQSYDGRSSLDLEFPQNDIHNPGSSGNAVISGDAMQTIEEDEGGPHLSSDVMNPFESGPTTSRVSVGACSEQGHICSRLSDRFDEDERNTKYDFFPIESSVPTGANASDLLSGGALDKNTTDASNTYSLSMDAPLRSTANGVNWSGATGGISLSMDAVETGFASGSTSTSAREDRRKQQIGSLEGTAAESSGAERRGSRKRKNSMPAITGPLSFRCSSAYGRTESDFLRMQGADESHSQRTGFLIRESDNSWKPSSSSSSSSASSSSGTVAASTSSIARRISGPFPSESWPFPQISPVRSVSVAPSGPQPWLSSSTYREVEANDNRSQAQEAGCWLAPVFGPRSGGTPVAVSWATASRNAHQLVAPTRERLTEEAGRRHGTPLQMSSWLGSTPVESQAGIPLSLPASSRHQSNNGLPNESGDNHPCANLAFTNSFLPLATPASVSAPPQSFSAPSSSSSSVPPVSSSMNREATADVASSSAGAALQYRPRSSSLRPSMFLDGQREGFAVPPVPSAFRMPLRGLRILSAAEGSSRHRLVTEILSALEHAHQRSDAMSFEELARLDPSMIFGEFDAHDRHRDMRIDVDNMSYEELLALEERIGNVSTGLTEETLASCLKINRYSSLEFTLAVGLQESEIKCCICQEDYVEEDEVARLICGHSYHTVCIKRWLALKNRCPICKAAAHAKP